MYDFINRINAKIDENLVPVIVVGNNEYSVKALLPNDLEKEVSATFLFVKTTNDTEVDIRINAITEIKYFSEDNPNPGNAKKFYDGLKNATKR